MILTPPSSVPCPREIRVPIGGIAYGYLLLRLLLLRGGRTNHRAERKAKHRPTDRGTAVIIVAITVIIAPGCRRFRR